MPFKKKLLHTGTISSDDEIMILAIQVVESRRRNEFQKWLEDLIKVNLSINNSYYLVSIMMDVAVLISQDDFFEQAEDFALSGRLAEVVNRAEVNPS